MCLLLQLLMKCHVLVSIPLPVEVITLVVINTVTYLGITTHTTVMYRIRQTRLSINGECMSGQVRLGQVRVFNVHIQSKLL